jgi:glutamine synthetase
MGIMNHTEVEARYEIELRNTPRKSKFEGRVLEIFQKNHANPNSYSLPKYLIET